MQPFTWYMLKKEGNSPSFDSIFMECYLVFSGCKHVSSFGMHEPHYRKHIYHVVVFLIFHSQTKKCMHVMYTPEYVYTNNDKIAICRLFKFPNELWNPVKSAAGRNIYAFLPPYLHNTSNSNTVLNMYYLTHWRRYADVKISIEAEEKAQKVFFVFLIYVPHRIPKGALYSHPLGIFLSLFGYICALYTP